MGPDFGRTFLASQSQTLTSIFLYFIAVDFPPQMSLPNVHTLRIHGCNLTGWDNICASFSSLKDLTLAEIEFSDHSSSVLPAPFPASSRLESLELFLCSDLDGQSVSWLDEHSKSCPNLRQLRVGIISDNALKSFLAHCRNMEAFGSFRDIPGSWDFPLLRGPTDEHLNILVRFAPPTLHTLNLRGGQFEDSNALDTFIASCQVSVKSLALSFSFGLTPSRLRALFRMPLTELEMIQTPVYRDDLQEMDYILKNEKPPCLLNLNCYFIPSRYYYALAPCQDVS